MEQKHQLNSNRFFTDAEAALWQNEPDYRGITTNEVHAYHKNKAEHQHLMRQVATYRRESRVNFSSIQFMKRKISQSMDVIDMTTGYLDPNEAAEATEAAATDTSRSLMESIRSTSGSIKSAPSHLYGRQKTKSMNSFVQPERPKSTVRPKSHANDSDKDILAKIEEATERAKIIIERLSRSKSVGILPQNRIRYRNVHSAIEFNPNPTEWNTYQTQKKLNESIDITKLDIEDKRLLDIYLKKCEVRNSVPKVSPKLVATLKQKDPVFAKRYRQFYKARICNQAPNFDYADNDITNKYFPRIDLWRLKKKVLSQAMNNTLVNKPTTFQHEMLKVNEKVKQFLNQVKITQLY